MCSCSRDMFHSLVYGHLFDTGNLQGFHLDGILDEQQVVFLLQLNIFL